MYICIFFSCLFYILRYIQCNILILLIFILFYNLAIGFIGVIVRIYLLIQIRMASISIINRGLPKYYYEC